jgi:hypothetical protein
VTKKSLAGTTTLAFWLSLTLKTTEPFRLANSSLTLRDLSDRHFAPMKVMRICTTSALGLAVGVTKKSLARTTTLAFWLP